MTDKAKLDSIQLITKQMYLEWDGYHKRMELNNTQNGLIRIIPEIMRSYSKAFCDIEDIIGNKQK